MCNNHNKPGGEEKKNLRLPSQMLNFIRQLLRIFILKRVKINEDHMIAEEIIGEKLGQAIKFNHVLQIFIIFV